MGADGHIGIYDYAKLEDKYDEEIVDSFMGHFTSGKMYVQGMSGKKYITRYWGDNYQCDDLYDVIQDCYSPETDTFNTKIYSYSAYEAEYFMKFDKEIRKTFAGMIQFLENEARITSWEVWT